MAASRAIHTGQSIPAYARTAGRAVHVKVHPQPRNLAESRGVLRVLQKYGEVIMYKHLKHEPNLHAANTVLAIYENQDAAQKVINASPLHFELEKEKPGRSASDYHGSVQIPPAEEKYERPEAYGQQAQPKRSDATREGLRFQAGGKHVMQGPAAGTAPSSDLSRATQHQDNIPAQATPTSKPASPTPKPFTSNPIPSANTQTSLPFPPTSSSPSASPSPNDIKDKRHFHLTITRSVLNHHAYIQRQHYYGGFNLNKMTTMAEDLERRVPVVGMVDCSIKKGEAPLRIRIKRQEKERLERRTLRELWEEGKREREAKGG